MAVVQANAGFPLALFGTIPKRGRIFLQPSFLSREPRSGMLAPKPAPNNRGRNQAGEGNGLLLASAVGVPWSPAPAAELLSVFGLLGADFSLTELLGGLQGGEGVGCLVVRPFLSPISVANVVVCLNAAPRCGLRGLSLFSLAALGTPLMSSANCI